MGQLTLKISIYECEKSIGIMLGGRVAGPWVAELSRVWVETAPQLNSRKLILDLRSVTYADSAGTGALRQIYAHCRPRLIAGSPWTEYLAGEIRARKSARANQEVDDATDVQHSR